MRSMFRWAALVISFGLASGVQGDVATDSPMRSERGVPVLVAVVGETVPLYRDGLAATPASYLGRRYGVAFLYELAGERALIGDSAFRAGCKTIGYVSRENLVVRPSNLALRPVADDRAPLWLTGRAGDLWELSSIQQAGSGILRVPKAMEWKGREAFARSLSTLKVVVVAGEGEPLLDESNMRNLRRSYLVGEQGDFLREFDMVGEAHVTWERLNGRSLDRILAEIGAAGGVDASESVFVLLVDEGRGSYGAIDAYTEALLREQGVRVYALGDSSLRETVASLVSATDGRFLWSGRISDRTDISEALREIVAAAGEEAAYLFTAAEIVAAGELAERRASAEDIRAVVQRGFRAMPPDEGAVEPMRVRPDTDLVGFFDSPDRLKDALYAYQHELHLIQNTARIIEPTAEDLQQIVVVLAALAEVFDLRLEPTVQRLIDEDNGYGAVKARNLLAAALHALPYLPPWARDVLDNDWRANFPQIEREHIAPLLERLRGYMGSEPTFIPMM